MARAIWSGSISFGLVNIPIRLANAVRRRSVSFHQIDRRTGARVKQQRVSAADGHEVPYEDVVKGYELASGQYVTISDEELAALDPEASRTIDIIEFVDLADIDPVFYDAAYHVVPDRTAVKPYRLLAEAMEQSGKVGIARFVMRTKQYLAAIRPKDGRLLLSTMVYADEVVSAEEVGGFEALEDVQVNDRERTMAVQLIESLSEPFDPGRFEDTHRNAVLELVERKAAGETDLVVAPAAAATDTVVDLMAALEASVREAKEARRRHPTARTAPGEATGGEEPAATPRKRAPRRKSA
ncbi:MAG: Ku protein [Acidimicrobiales bacterium]|jgi:DNA end-binding protein Ku|nr:Ku protein [Acidimicrobiales bacterium]